MTMQMIQDKFLPACPLVQRTMAFFQCKQQQGPKVAGYIAKLTSLAAVANLRKLTIEDLHVLQPMVGIQDTRIQETLQREQQFVRDQFF